MIDFVVRPDDGDEYRVTATARDVLRWEKTNRGKTFKGLMESLSMVDLYALAHTASVRQGLYADPLKDFETAVELDFEHSAELDPTKPVP